MFARLVRDYCQNLFFIAIQGRVHANTHAYKYTYIFKTNERELFANSIYRVNAFSIGLC